MATQLESHPHETVGREMEHVALTLGRVLLGDKGIQTILAIEVASRGTDGHSSASRKDVVERDRFDSGSAVVAPLEREPFPDFAILFVVHFADAIFPPAQLTAPFAVTATHSSAPFSVVEDIEMCTAIHVPANLRPIVGDMIERQ